mgnify:CR=1 FL=1
MGEGTRAQRAEQFERGAQSTGWINKQDQGQVQHRYVRYLQLLPVIRVNRRNATIRIEVSCGRCTTTTP